jgi:hypothetical protein
MTVASSETATVTLPTDDQILITREFDAPKHLVYRAWTSPELVKRWWHANRGEMTVAEIDLRIVGDRRGLSGRHRSLRPAGRAGPTLQRRWVTGDVGPVPRRRAAPVAPDPRSRQRPDP